MAAPFEQAFQEYGSLAEQMRGYTTESAPQGVKEGGSVRAIHYREEEAIYIKASHDRVTVIFSTVFREETDRVFGKIFLQEFVDARRRAIQNAPQVMFRNDPPLELQGLPGLKGGKGEIGYITFGTSHQHALLTHPFITQANKHLHCSPLPPPPHPPKTSRRHLAHPNFPRLLPLPHQSQQSIHPLTHAAADGRFPASSKEGTAGDGGEGEEDGVWKDV